MYEIKFADVGEGITEGRVQKWLVGDGAQVKEDQPVVQIETDKAVVNIPSPIDGKIRIVAREGSDVAVGSVLAYVGTESEQGAGGLQQPAQATVSQAAQAQAAAPEAAEAQAQRSNEVLATPYVRKLARELGVEIGSVRGTGTGGRVLENDVRAHAGKRQQAAPPAKFSEVLEERHAAEVERVPLSQTRKAIARNMELSWTIPRAVHMDMADATHLAKIVDTERERVVKEFGVKLSYLPFIIKAAVAALKQNPNFNASYDHERLEIVRKRYYNIGLAAEAQDGLKVIVVKGAHKLGIVEIAAEMQRLRGRLAAQTITLEEMRDSTFTITNIGSLHGGFLSVPMINYPDVAILGVHMIRDVPLVRNERVVIGKQLPLSLSFDHRVVDGAEAVKFCNALIGYLEDPEFLEML